jgi:hypothetical protein
MSKPEIDYNDLARELTDPLTPVNSTKRIDTGSAAAEIGHEFLLRAYGSEGAIEREMVSPGRPRVGAPTGPSPTVRARITPLEYELMKQLEARTGRTQSDLVREAVHQLLLNHKLVS